jgi:ATP-binding cassette subfamily C protein
MGSEGSQRLWRGEPAGSGHKDLRMPARDTEDWLADIEAAVRELTELADQESTPAARSGASASSAPRTPASAPAARPQALKPEAATGSAASPEIELKVEDLVDITEYPWELWRPPLAAVRDEVPAKTDEAKARPPATDRPAGVHAATPAPKFAAVTSTPFQDNAPGARLRPAPATPPLRRPENTTVSGERPQVATARKQEPRPSAPQARVDVPPKATAPDRKTADPEARVDQPQAKRTPDSPGHIPPIIHADRGPLGQVSRSSTGGGRKGVARPPSGGGGGGNRGGFHRRAEMPNFAESFQKGVNAVRHNIAIVMMFTLVINILVLAIPVYLFQISDRVLTSRSVDTLIMLTVVVVGAVLLQAVLDAIRRFILMRTAVEVEAQLGAPILAAAARSSLNGSSRDYQVLGDLQQLRSFITSGTLIAILDAPLAPIFVLAVFLIEPQLGYVVVVAALCLLVIALINQRMTARHFAESNSFLSRATLHLDSMSRNSQIINALAMIPEAVRIWGKDTALSLKAQVRAQDRNIVLATLSKTSRLVTQVTMLGWGAHLSLDGELTGGMVIAASIISARALTPIEGAIEGWHSFIQFRHSFQRIRSLLQSSPFNFERLLLPDPKGRLDVERILFVPPPNKKVILNGVSFSLMPGESLAVIGNSGAGKTTLGKMLVGSILPTSGSVRLDLMDLRNWDQRQFGENIGYLPQDVQLFPGTIKANIGRMREDASDEAIYAAAVLADVHELIASFPQGYETFVAADGAPLSGGQKQRIALARAFFGDPKLVVLDEPNSNLDSPGEAALAKALIHARKQKITVVTITQRTALLNYVDKILVLNNGTVSAFGERKEILQAIARSSAGADGRPRLEEGE